MLVKSMLWNAKSSILVVPLGMMPSPFMILYFAIFLLTIAFVSRGGYIGDINSLKSYVAVVFWGVVVLCGLLLLLCKVEVIGHSTLEKAAKVS